VNIHTNGVIVSLSARLLSALYGVLLIVTITALIHFGGGEAAAEAFKDRRVVENLQVVLFLGAVLSAGFGAWRAWQADRPRFWALACVTSGLLWGANRELDSYWKPLGLPWMYDVLSAVFCTATIVIAVLRFKHCLSMVRRVLRRTSLQLLVAGAAVYALAQGKSVVLGPLGMNRVQGGMVEEGAELVGAILFMLGSVELHLENWREQVRMRKEQATNPEAAGARVQAS
jgi:hypothetical protein